MSHAISCSYGWNRISCSYGWNRDQYLFYPLDATHKAVDPLLESFTCAQCSDLAALFSKSFHLYDCELQHNLHSKVHLELVDNVYPIH